MNTPRPEPRTGEGLGSSSPEHASVVVDVTDAPSYEDAAVLAFVPASTRNLIPGGNAEFAATRFEDWLDQQVQAVAMTGGAPGDGGRER